MHVSANDNVQHIKLKKYKCVGQENK